jgi:hypothetical protein
LESLESDNEVAKNPHRSSHHPQESSAEEILLEERVVLRILDARALLSAKANAAMGKGHEVVKRLGGEVKKMLIYTYMYVLICVCFKIIIAHD